MEFFAIFWRFFFSTKFIGQTCFGKLDFFHEHNALLFFNHSNSGVQSINNVYAIVNKVENVLVNTYIFDLIDNGVYVVYALYSRIDSHHFLDKSKT